MELDRVFKDTVAKLFVRLFSIFQVHAGQSIDDHLNAVLRCAHLLFVLRVQTVEKPRDAKKLKHVLHLLHG